MPTPASTASKPIIVYCRIGERSSHTWFVLSKILGYDVRNYDGSWTEYGNSVGVPDRQRRRDGLGRQVTIDCGPAITGPRSLAPARPRKRPRRVGGRRASAHFGRAPHRLAIAIAHRPRRSRVCAAAHGSGRAGLALVAGLRRRLRLRAAALPLLLLLQFPRLLDDARPARAARDSRRARGRHRRLHHRVRRLAAGSPTGRLPPEALIGPVSLVLMLAGLAFGAGMAISGSCISAHLYRLGEGSPTAPFALAGRWSASRLASLPGTPSISHSSRLRRRSGCRAGSAIRARSASQLAVLAGVAWLLLRRRHDVTAARRRRAGPCTPIFVARWPAWAGGLAVGASALPPFCGWDLSA